MHKFESTGHNRLDVLNISDYIPCYLNRQIIIILSSLGICDTVFDTFQDHMIKMMCEMLTNKQIAANYLLKYFRGLFPYTANNEKFNYCNDAFFRDLLKTKYQKQLQGLVKKSRIFVQKGRILMGTVDETGTLRENEVFIKCNMNEYERKYFSIKNSYNSKIIANGNSFIVSGKVIVAKNPCMHPGDVRILNAVYNPSLLHMVDCLVFPACGKRPIPKLVYS
jgi:RNA-dependent RNA polymerase